MEKRIKVEVRVTVVEKAALVALKGVTGFKKIECDISGLYDFEVEDWGSIGRLRLYEQSSGVYRFFVLGIIYDPKLLRAVVNEEGVAHFEIAPHVTLEDLLYDIGY